MQRLLLAFLLAALATACTDATASDDGSDDGEASVGDPQNLGKADALAFLGLYSSHASTHREGDVIALELADGGAYVRSRCYHAACALPLPETDTYDTYKTASGKTYVRFWSFKVVDAGDQRSTVPHIADVYEIKSTSTGIKLRKAYTSRWVTLRHDTASALCSRDGGTWATDACTCPGNVEGEWPAFIFVAGAGGCMANPGASEDGCDTSDGMWTDDDATLIGSFCKCGLGRYDDADGACAAI